MSKDLINADTMHSKMETAINTKPGNAFVDCLVLFGRLVQGQATAEEIDDIKDVDLDDCSKEYAREWRRTWAMLDRKLTTIIEDKS